jgi:WXG100 family type VII secretion target
MATQQTNVDIAGMKAAQPHFETALSETARTYNNMHDQASVLEGSWQGGTSQIFITALNQWLDNFKTVEQQLQIVTQKLEANTGNYQNVVTNTDDSATALRNVMNAGLPGF